MTKKVSTKRNFCNYCNKIVLGSSYKFKSHLFRHNAVKPRFICKYCSKEYFRKDTYKRHVKGHFGERDTKQFICDYCDRCFVNKFSLIVHLKNIHDDTIDSKRVRFTCKTCSIAFCEKRVLDNHIKRYHFKVDLNKKPTHFNRNINEKWIEKVVSTDTCVEITKINNNMITIKKCSDINMADIEHGSEDKILYEKQFLDQYSKAICDYCKKEMIKKSLRSHIRERHLNLRKYKCTDCCKTFKRHYQMVDHKCGRVRRREINRIR